MTEDDRPYIDPDLCMQRGEVVRLIPDVKPNLAIRAIEDAAFAHVMGEPYRGLEITEDDVAAASYGGEMERQVLTLNGARLLRKLFQAGLIEQKRKTASKDLSALEAYIATEPELQERTVELREQARARREAREAEWQALDARAREIAANPSLATTADLSVRMTDRVFIHALGYGHDGRITLAGCECHKLVQRYVSNSGKTRRATPYCWWVDGDGQRHGEEPPEQALNRRSDPDRNWGLGRE